MDELPIGFAMALAFGLFLCGCLSAETYWGVGFNDDRRLTSFLAIYRMKFTGIFLCQIYSPCIFQSGRIYSSTPNTHNTEVVGLFLMKIFHLMLPVPICSCGRA